MMTLLLGIPTLLEIKSDHDDGGLKVWSDLPLCYRPLDSSPRVVFDS